MNLRAVTLAENCIVRTARKEYRCIGAEPVRSYEAVRHCHHRMPDGSTADMEGSYRYKTMEQAEAGIERQRRGTCHPRFPETAPPTFEIVPVPNPEYHPDCLGVIHPGDTYVEYRGDTPQFFMSGTRYCAACAERQWVAS